MNKQDQLEMLLVDWELSRQRGKDLSAEDLCRDQPTLVPELTSLILNLKQMDWLEESDDFGEDFLHLPDFSSISIGSDITHFEEANISVEEFCQRLVESELMTQDQVDQLKQRFQTGSARSFALHLVDDNKLTSFQALVLLEGRDIPLVLDRYILLSEVGRGGMGAVYKALHQQMDRVVALKILPRQSVDSPEKLRRFHREVKVAAKLDHPNIVTTHDATEAKGFHFLVMSLVCGSDLGAVVRKDGPLSVAKAVDYVLQAARGLEHAHQMGIVHRDIKPGNLLLDKKGRVKVLDMGLARIDAAEPGHEQTESLDLTQAGVVMGTIAYLPPEQALDTRMADARSDIYSLGCTLFYLLTGKPIFWEDTTMKTIMAHREQEIPSLQSKREGVPAQLDAIFQKMVAKSPVDRFLSMTELIAALKALEIEEDDQSLPVAAQSTVFQTTATYLDTSREIAKPHHTSASATSRRGWGWIAIILLAAIGFGGAWAAGIIFKVETPAGTIVLEIDQPELAGAVVSVDGEKKITIQTGKEQQPIVVVADEKTHTLKVAKGGFETFTREFTVIAGGDQKIRVTLNPITEPMGKPGETATPTTFGLSFDGEDDYVSIENIAIPIDPKTGFQGYSIEAWVTIGASSKRNTDALEIDSELGRIEIYADSNEDGPAPWRCSMKSKSTKDYHIPFGAKVVANQRVHVAGVWDGNVFNFYVDGRRASVGDLSGRTVIHDRTHDIATLQVGRSLHHDRHFVGTIDEIRVSTGRRYEHEFTPAQRFLSESDTVAIYRFEEGQGDLLHDSSGNGLHGKIVGAKWVELVTPAESQEKAEQQLAEVVQKLQERNQDFDGRVSHKIEGGEVTELAFLTDHVTDISPVASLINLKRLDCSGSGRQKGKLVDLSPLSGMKLKRLVLSNNDQITDLSSLQGMPLEELNFSDCYRIVDLRTLSGMPLRELSMDRVYNLVDLSPLRGASLNWFSLESVKTRDLSPLAGMPIEYLNISGTKVTDLAPIQGAPLKQFTCVNTNISDLSPLRGMPLEELNVSHTIISSLAPLEGMPLAILGISHTQVDDLSPMKGMSLYVLEMGYTHVADLTPITDMPLTYLHFSGTPVSDLSPLTGMQITDLELTSTKVTDLSALKGMPLKRLCFHRTPGAGNLHLLEELSLEELHTQIALFDDPDEKFFRSLNVPRLNGPYTGGAPTAEYWQEFDERRTAVEDFAEATSRLTVKQQVDAVATRLNELNPNDVVELKPTIEEDAVVGVSLTFSEKVEDITPLRAFSKLKSLTLIGGFHALQLSPICSLPIEALDCDESMVRRNAFVLWNDKSLKTINAQPAREYLEGLWKSQSTSTKWQPDAQQQEFLDKVKDLSVEARLQTVLAKLVELNPGFDGQSAQQIEDGHVVAFELGSQVIEHVWPVRAFSRMHTFRYYRFGRDGKLSDLSQLSGLPLKVLDISHSAVSDLSPLEGMPINELSVVGTKVVDLTPLKGLPITKLVVNYTDVSDLSTVQGMPLKSLHMGSVPAVDLSPLKGLSLEKIDLSSTLVTDLSALKGMPINSLVLNNTNFTDLDAFQETPPANVQLLRSPWFDFSTLKDKPIEELRFSIRLFDPEEEELLRSLKAKNLSAKLWPHPYIPREQFWKQFEARQQAAIDFAQQTSQAPVAQQTAAVLAQLRQINNNQPYLVDPEITLDTEIADGQITKVSLLLGNYDEDISPLRAFGQLQHLVIKGGSRTTDISPLKILPLESIICSQEIVQRNIKFLREMPSVKTINGEQTGKYLKAVEQSLLKTIDEEILAE